MATPIMHYVCICAVAIAHDCMSLQWPPCRVGSSVGDEKVDEVLQQQQTQVEYNIVYINRQYVYVNIKTDAECTGIHVCMDTCTYVEYIDKYKQT